MNDSIVQGGYTGSGNSSSDPVFVAPVGAAVPPSAADLRLQAASPAIDAGDAGAVPAGVTTDLDGGDRVVGPGVEKWAPTSTTCPSSPRHRR